MVKKMEKKKKERKAKDQPKKSDLLHHSL